MAAIGNMCGRMWRCFVYDNRDITAWMKTACARGPTTTIVALFSATALLFIAQSLDDDCDDSVDIGIATLKISSILSGAQVVENIVNLFLAPYFGALADSSNNRKGLLIFSSGMWVGAMGLGGLLLAFDPSLLLLWMFFLSMLVVAVFYELAVLLTFAYLPEVVKDEEQLMQVSSRQYAIVNGVQLIAAGVMVVIIGITPEDTFKNDQPFSLMAHMLSVGWFLYYGLPGIYYLPSRGKLEEKAKTLAEADDADAQEDDATEPAAKPHAYSQMLSTFKEIRDKYPQVKWFLLGWIFYFAGIASVTVLQVAYVTEEFDYTTSDVSFIGGALLVASVIGAASAEFLSKLMRLKSLLLFAILLWAFSTLIAPFLLTGQERDPDNFKNESEGDNPAGCEDFELITREPTDLAALMVFVFSMTFGFGVGFIYPVSTAIYSMIIPGGEEATYFGVKTFGAKVLAWAPPLIFTGINEGTGNLQIAFMSLSIWFFASLPFVCMLNVDQGVADVKHTLHKRRGAGKHLLDAYDHGRRPSVQEIMEEETKAVERASAVHAVVSVVEGKDELPEGETVPEAEEGATPLVDKEDVKKEGDIPSGISL